MLMLDAMKCTKTPMRMYIDKHYYTIYSVLPDSRSEPNTQALLTPGHSVSLQFVRLRGLTIKKEMKEGMNREKRAHSCFSDS